MRLQLTPKDCLEIYYALDRRLTDILRGKMNAESPGPEPDSPAQEWALHIRKVGWIQN